MEHLFGSNTTRIKLISTIYNFLVSSYYRLRSIQYYSGFHLDLTHHSSLINFYFYLCHSSPNWSTILSITNKSMMCLCHSFSNWMTIFYNRPVLYASLLAFRWSIQFFFVHFYFYFPSPFWVLFATTIILVYLICHAVIFVCTIFVLLPVVIVVSSIPTLIHISVDHIAIIPSGIGTNNFEVVSIFVIVFFLFFLILVVASTYEVSNNFDLVNFFQWISLLLPSLSLCTSHSFVLVLSHLYQFA